MKLQDRIAALGLYLFPFRVLAKAQSHFRNVAPGTFAERKLFGSTYISDVSRWPQQAIYLLGQKYIPEASLIQKLIRPGMTVVDVGANVGYYLLLLRGLVGDRGRVVAIEPSPENLTELQLNVDRNGFKNVTIVPKAVGESQARVGLRGGINSGVVAIAEAKYMVEIDSLDNMAFDAVDMIKIDIEGYEMFALRGAAELIAKHKPIIFVEIHPDYLIELNSSAAEVVEELRGNYQNISFYRSRPLRGFFQKILSYYFGIGSIERVENPDLLINDLNSGTYWVICKP